MSSGPLSIDVYVAPMRPYISPDRLRKGEVANWAPSSSTLISRPRAGVLIDALLTCENAARIAAWAKNFRKTITGVLDLGPSRSRSTEMNWRELRSENDMDTYMEDPAVL